MKHKENILFELSQQQTVYTTTAIVRAYFSCQNAERDKEDKKYIL